MLHKLEDGQSLYVRPLDKAFKVTAVCTTAGEANRFIEANPTHTVAAVLGEFIFLTQGMDNDPGFDVPAEYLTAPRRAAPVVKIRGQSYRVMERIPFEVDGRQRTHLKLTKATSPHLYICTQYENGSYSAIEPVLSVDTRITPNTDAP